MCTNVQYLESKKIKLIKRYEGVLPMNFVPSNPQTEIKTFYFISGFEHPKLPLITGEGVILSEWGLLPNWVNDLTKYPKIQDSNLNARAETIHDKPSFKDAIKSNRAILPINGFYEFREFNGIKYPYFISLKSKDLMSIAVIYNLWKDPQSNQLRNTFSIITTEPNSLLSQIHNRMPVILNPENEAEWVSKSLSTDRINDLMKPYDGWDLITKSISKNANNYRSHRNHEGITNLFNYPELPDIQLDFGSV